MTATAKEIRDWVYDGKRRGATHVIIAVDTWDHDNYPVYVMPGMSVQVEARKRQGVNMQRVDEVYAMHLDLDKQLDEHRAHHYENPEESGKTATALQALAALTDDERLEVFQLYCTYCGTDDPRCQCENDQ